MRPCLRVVPNVVSYGRFFSLDTIPVDEWGSRRDDVVRAMDGGMTLVGRSFTVEDERHSRVLLLSGKDIGRYCGLTFWDETQMRIYPYQTQPKVYIGVKLMPSSAFEASVYQAVGMNIMAVALRNTGFPYEQLYL